MHKTDCKVQSVLCCEWCGKGEERPLLQNKSMDQKGIPLEGSWFSRSISSAS